MTLSSPSPIVVDASAFVERLLGGRRSQAVEQAVGVSPMIAPSHLDVEVINALRGLARSGQIDDRRGEEATLDLIEAPLERVDMTGLIPQIWGWRQNLSAYDAAYAALAGALACPLISADRRLARAVRDSVSVIVV